MSKRVLWWNIKREGRQGWGGQDYYNAASLWHSKPSLNQNHLKHMVSDWGSPQGAGATDSAGERMHFINWDIFSATSISVLFRNIMKRHPKAWLIPFRWWSFKPTLQELQELNQESLIGLVWYIYLSFIPVPFWLSHRQRSRRQRRRWEHCRLCPGGEWKPAHDWSEEVCLKIKMWHFKMTAVLIPTQRNTETKSCCLQFITFLYSNCSW